MSKLDSATTTLTYHGEQVRQLLAAHADVVQATGSYCAGLVDATVKVHAEAVEKWPLAWSLSMSSPAGRSSLTISQRTPGAKVSFTRF